MTTNKGGRLPRLSRSCYQGNAVIHWVQTLAHRAVGWLNSNSHQHFRELMLHTAARHHLICPVYNLMPDHQHLIWMGLHPTSDQLNAMAFLRTYLEKGMKPFRFQRQAYDHLLRAREREMGALSKTCFYILNNPVRAGLVESPEQWPYHGAIAPGYPDWDPLSDGFWDRFWKVYEQQLDRQTIEGSAIQEEGR